MSTPAGWYPDPVESEIQRWWDGAQWTEQTAPITAGQAPADAGYGGASGRPASPYGGAYGGQSAGGPAPYGGPMTYGAGPAPFGAPGPYGPGPAPYGAPGAYGMGGYPYAEPKRNSTVLIVLGYVFSLLVALVGLILGVVLLTRDEKGHGIAVVLISLLNILVTVLITIGN